MTGHCGVVVLLFPPQIKTNVWRIFPILQTHGNPDVTQFQELSFRSFEFGRLPCYQLPWLRKRCRFNLWLIWYMFCICMCTYLYTLLSYAQCMKIKEIRTGIMYTKPGQCWSWQYTSLQFSASHLSLFMRQNLKNTKRMDGSLNILQA